MEKELTQREMASKGGKAILKKMGKKYFKELAKLRWKKGVNKSS